MNEEYKRAYDFSCSIIYNLIMRDYRSELLHNQRKFNPTIFLRRAKKYPVINSVVNPMAILEDMEKNGLLLRGKSQDYSKTLFQITEKFCEYLPEVSNFRITMPLEQKGRFYKEAQKAITKREKQVKEIIEEIVDDIDSEHDKHTDFFGIRKLRKKLENNEISVTKSSVKKKKAI